MRLLAGNSSAVTDLVRSGAADLGFVETPIDAPDVSRWWSLWMSSQPSSRRTIRGHIFPASPRENWRHPPLLREEGSGTRATLEAWLADAGLHLSPPAAVLDTTGIIRANARAGIAPAVMSLRTVDGDLAGGTLVRVPLLAPPLTRPLRAMWSGRPGPAATTFLRIVRGPGAFGHLSP